MKLECGIEKIKNGILQVEKITGKNLTLPILSSILFIASGKSLKLRSTNLSLGVEIEIPAKIEKEGIVAISGVTMAGIFSNVFQNENIFITDRISGETKKYSLGEVIRELTQKKDIGQGPSTVQGFDGTPAWAIKQKIYEDKTILLGETYEPERQREFMPDPDEVETEQEQELEYGDEEEDGGDMNPDLDDAPANSVESNLSHVAQVNKLNVSGAEKNKLLYGTEDNPEGRPNGGDMRNMPNEGWKKYWNFFALADCSGQMSAKYP